MLRFCVGQDTKKESTFISNAFIGLHMRRIPCASTTQRRQHKQQATHICSCRTAYSRFIHSMLHQVPLIESMHQYHSTS